MKIKSKNFEPFFVGVPHEKKPFIVPKYNIPEFPPGDNDTFFADDHDLQSIIDCDTLQTALDIIAKTKTPHAQQQYHQEIAIMSAIDNELAQQGLSPTTIKKEKK